MKNMTLNPEFEKNILDTYRTNGEAWLTELPNHIAELASLWDFEFLHPLSQLTNSFVGLVKLKSNHTPSILKMTPPNSNINTEIKWLKSIEEAVPKIYFSDEQKHAFIMENLTPGYPLKTLVKKGEDDKATKIICETILHLQSHQHKEMNFPHIADLANALPILNGHYDSALLSEAQSLFRDLTTDRTEDIILHGDLHHDNILFSGTEWKAIDPHGYIGDPAAEVGVMIRNPYDCFPTQTSLSKVIERRLKIMSEQLPFEPQKIKYWCLCMTVLSTAWHMEGSGKIPNLEIEVAHAISRTKI